MRGHVQIFRKNIPRVLREEEIYHVRGAERPGTCWESGARNRSGRTWENICILFLVQWGSIEEFPVGESYDIFKKYLLLSISIYLFPCAGSWL